MQSETGFLLSYLKYGDQDAILHVFTKESGYESFFLKGLYSPKNKKKAYLSPLNELIFSHSQKSGKQSLPLLTKIENLHSINNADIRASSVIIFIADFLNHNLRNEAQNPAIYTKIKKFIDETELNNYSSYLIFLINFLHIHGFCPTGSGNFLNPESGEFSGQQAHQNFSLEISEIWKTIINSPAPYNIKIRNKKDFLDSVIIYFHYHFPEFRTPVSLEIIRQLF